MSRSITISAVVITLNEGDNLARLLPTLLAEVDEVVVSDGGSADETLAVARTHPTRVVEAPRGRGHQIAAGCEAAQMDVFWVLHADTTLSAGMGQQLRQAAREHPWGCFAVTFDDRDPRLRLAARIMNLRARRWGSCTGDMGQWFRRDLYRQIGGCSELSAFEDLDLSDRARGLAAIHVCTPRLVTSSRRWRTHGVNRTIALMWTLRLGYRLGVDPDFLARAYW